MAFGRVAAVVLLVMPLAALAQLNPGKITGTARFTNASSPAVAAFLAEHPVQAGSLTAVRLVRQGQLATVASAPYTASGGIDPLASYELHPEVAPTGSNFFIELASILFHGGASYRFGSALSGATATTLCGPVMPETDDPDGTSCSLAECVALASVPVRFTGPDIDALDASINVACKAEALLEDVPGSNLFNIQASGVFVKTVAELEAGTSMPFLVRSGSRVKVRVTCNATPAEDGFVVDPVTDLTTTTATIGPLVLECDADSVLPVAELEVRKLSGRLIGLFDAVGRTKSAASIRASSFTVSPTLIPAGSTPDPASPWTFEGVPVGDIVVSAAALIDAGRARVEFPKRSGPNGLVRITQGETTDLGRTFVAVPRDLPGRIVLSDPSGETALSQIRTAPLSSLSDHFTTYVEAAGNADTVAGGASGHLGVAASVVTGQWDPATREADLGYSLPLVGISTPGNPPAYAPLDGKSWLATPWDVDLLHLHIGGNVQESVIRFGTDLHFVATPPQDANDVAEPMPEQRICFGEAQFKLITAAGTLHSPALTIGAGALAQPQPGSDATPFSYLRGAMNGTPPSSDPPVGEARVTATLPAGIRYSATPSVTLRPTGGGPASRLTLASISIPEIGTIACGANSQDCIRVEGDGTSTRLSIGAPAAPLCTVSQQITMQIPIRSNGLEVDAVETALDGGAFGVACTSCGVNPTVAFSANDVPAGSHVVRVRAFSGTCTADASFPIELAAPFAFSCPANLELALGPGETSIPRNDPRLAPALSASTTGGCGGTVTVTAPDSFVAGANTVVFSASDGRSCTTTVTVTQSRHLAFTDGNAVKVARIDDGQIEWQQPGSAGVLEYDAAGSILGILRAGGLETRDAQTGTLLATFPGHFSNFAFRPTDSRDVAFVKAPQAMLGEFHLQILLGSANGAFAEQTLWTPITPPAFIVDPKVAWSEDGRRVAVAFNILSGGPTQTVLVVYREWVVNGITLGPPAVAMQWNPLTDWPVPAGNTPATDMVIDLGVFLPGPNVARMLGTDHGLYRVVPELPIPRRFLLRNFVDFEFLDPITVVLFEPAGGGRQIGIVSQAAEDGPVVDAASHSIAAISTSRPGSIANSRLFAAATPDAITIHSVTRVANTPPVHSIVRTIPAVNPKTAEMAFRP